MKKIINKSLGLILAATLIFTSCEDDSITPSLETFSIEDYDLIQVTNAQPSIPVSISAKSSGIDNISVIVTPADGGDAVASNTLREITSDNLNKIKLNIPFPLPEEAPSGLYTISYTIEDEEGKTVNSSYTVNVLNYRSVTADPCVFPTMALPPGTNVWLQVTVPTNTNGDDLYISGNFEGAVAGCSGDWSGGGCSTLKLTQLSSTCYYIALNLTASSEFKITRGAWGTENCRANGTGADNIKWNNSGVQAFTVENWADRVVLPKVTLPAGAIQTGKITVVADVQSTDNAIKYYLIQSSATSLDGAIEMIRVEGTSQMAAAVPKTAGVKYIVVKDVIEKTGVNPFGFNKMATIDGQTNPTTISLSGFKTEYTPTPVPAELFVVGEATPGGWSNPVPTPTQQFTSAGANKFTLTLALTGGKAYLLLPVNGSWDAKFGMGGQNPLTGDLIPGGGDFKSPDAAGTYKITADFELGTYTLELQ